MLTVMIGGRWQTARRATPRPLAAPWRSRAGADGHWHGGWQRAEVRQLESAEPWGAVPERDAGATGSWQRADALHHEPLTGRWGDLRPVDCATLGAWDRSIQPRDLHLRLIYNPKPSVRDVLLACASRRSNEYGPRYNAATALQDSLYIPGSGPLVFDFGGRPYFPSTQPAVFFDFRYEPERPRIQPTDSSAGVRWESARRLNRAAWLPWGRARVLDGALTGLPYVDYPGPVKPLPEPPPDPTIKDTYMIANLVTLYALPDRTPIEARSISIRLDADSFSWTLSADIFTRAALEAVRPGGSGDGEVEVVINGWRWVFVVEKYTRALKFPTEAYSITGSSRTQLLAAPYAPLRTGVNDAPITARQAAEAELLYTGFTLHWDAEEVGPPDWTFPAGALSYQSHTPMQVIARLAETVGGIVRPARDADELEVRPRYVSPPWEWSQPDAPIDRIIPPAMMTDLSGEWTPQPAWNACYTSGTSHGVSMLVRRAGTAGDNETPDVYDDWLTDQPANRQRGLHELCKGGDIEIVGVTIPLFHEGDDHGVGLILPGQLCRVPEETGAWVGLCLSVEISAEGTGASQVKQAIKLERHHSWPQ